jgi:hypothetical protein
MSSNRCAVADLLAGGGVQVEDAGQADHGGDFDDRAGTGPAADLDA